MLRSALFILLFFSEPLFAQKIIARKTDSAECFVFLNERRDGFRYYVGKYDSNFRNEGKYMVKWGISKSGDLYWTDGENIYRNDWKESNSTMIFGGLHWILEFCAIGDNIYVVYNPKKEEGPHDNRFEPGLKFCRIHIRSGVKEDLSLPRGSNVTNLAVSPDETWVSFIDTKAGKHVRYDLVLYSLLNGKMRIIDSAFYDRGTWFGNDGMKNSSFWSGTDSLFYYKHTAMGDFGQVLLYQVGSRSKVTFLEHFPQRDFFWFSVMDGFFYSSDRLSVYKTRDGLKNDILYKIVTYRSGFLNAEIVR